jgi:hypothetical protein
MGYLIANVFEINTNQIDNKENLDLVMSFDSGKVIITENLFKCITASNLHYEFEIQKVEDEIYTTTHHGKFPNGDDFRLIQPTSIGLNSSDSASDNEAPGGFTFGGLNKSGWAVSFILTKNQSVKYLDTKDDVLTDMIKNHVNTCNLAISYGNTEQILGAFKKMIELIKNNPSVLFRCEEIDKILKFLNGNSHTFNEVEQEVIDELI